MGFFSKFERRVEDGFDDMGDKFFDSPISPVQIAKKAEKQMRREKMVGAGKEYAPTLYTVLVNPEDDERLFGYYPTLAGETETYLRGKAQEMGLAMDGDPLVRFIIDDELKRGKFEVVAELVSEPIVSQLRAEEMQRYGLEAQQSFNQRSEQVPASQPAAPIKNNIQQQSNVQQYPAYASSGIDVMAEEPAAYANMNNVPVQNAALNNQVSPVVNNMTGAAAAPVAYGNASQAAQGNNNQTTRINQQGYAPQHSAGRGAVSQAHLVDLTSNRSFPLEKDCIILGRALSSDLAIEDLNVSRTHAEIRRENTNAWSIADLGSTNGTLVNGHHIASVMLQEGDQITIGTTTFLFTFQ